MAILLVLKKLLFSYWKELLVVAAIIYGISFIYGKGYDSGYAESKTYYEQQIAEDKKDLVDNIDSILKLAKAESKKNIDNHNDLVSDLNKITSDIRSKKLVVIKNGECLPSESFLDSYTSIIRRGNSK